MKQREGYIQIREVLNLSEEDKTKVATIVATNINNALNETDALVFFELNGKEYTLSLAKEKLEPLKFKCEIIDNCMHLTYEDHTILKINKEGKLLLAHMIPPNIGLNVNIDGRITMADSDTEE